MSTRHSLPTEVLSRLAVSADALIDAQIVMRRGAEFVDLRPTGLQVRTNDDGTRGVYGYATTWDTWYDVAGGAPYGWSETIARGAATKSLAERDDVRFLSNHEGLPMARTASRTMTLTADDLGLAIDIPSLDPSNPAAAELLSCLDRGDVDQMSFAFIPTRQEWNADYTQRRILELKLVDVSAVTYPANPATIIAARSAHTNVRRFPLSLALAQAAALG